MSKQPTPSYPQDFAEVLSHTQQARQRVLAQANTALIDLYWRIGQNLSRKVAQAGWGKGVVSELARYITQADPTIRGFSGKYLWRMKQFYEAYEGDEKLSPLLRALPWSHNLAIFSRCKTADERRFYLALAAKERYTFRELDRQINASNSERTRAAPAKLSTALREMHPTLDQTFKDRCVLEFLGQLNFYLEALCRDKDDEVVEYALSRNRSPALLAQYQLQFPDKKLIASKMHELLAMHEGASDD